MSPILIVISAVIISRVITSKIIISIIVVAFNQSDAINLFLQKGEMHGNYGKWSVDTLTHHFDNYVDVIFLTSFSSFDEIVT